MSQAPIVIEPYDPEWPAKFEAERSLIEGAIGPTLSGTVEHIGSTSVPGLAAKPVIDIMAGVESLEAGRPMIPLIEAIGYWYYPYKPEQMHWFCKPSDVVRTHHLHLVVFKGDTWHKRLAFRDALRANLYLARAYEQLKGSLASDFRDDRDAYTDAKSKFIQDVIQAHDQVNGLSHPES